MCETGCNKPQSLNSVNLVLFSNVFCVFFSFLFLPVFSPGKGVQMQRDVQCCMLYSQGKVRTKDVLRFEVQTEGPDCSIQAIMQVFQLSTPGAKERTAICRHGKYASC